MKRKEIKAGTELKERKKERGWSQQDVRNHERKHWQKGTTIKTETDGGRVSSSK